MVVGMVGQGSTEDVRGGFQRDMKFRKVERKRGDWKDKMSEERTRRRNASSPFPRNDLTSGKGDSIRTDQLTPYWTLVRVVHQNLLGLWKHLSILFKLQLHKILKTALTEYDFGNILGELSYIITSIINFTGMKEHLKFSHQKIIHTKKNGFLFQEILTGGYFSVELRDMDYIILVWNLIIYFYISCLKWVPLS